MNDLLRLTKAALGWALLGCSVATAASGATLAPGTAFPRLDAAGLEGSLPDLSAARVIVVDFWASWCAPCKASFPLYSELQREYGPKGIVIVAVSVDESSAAMKAFVERTKPGFAVVRDAAQQLVKAVGVPTMPTSFVLDAKGIVRFVHAGFHGDSTRRAYVEEIKTILEEKL